MARVETQVHLAFRCDPEWGEMHKCSGFKPVSPRAFVVSFSSCFNSKLLLALQFPRRDRLRKVLSFLGVDVELLFVAGGCVVAVVGELAVASRGS